ncbi:hypothetical protein OYT13_22705 [Pandoraea sp. XJJ-1]|uniref:hypothetical protein n=1 Tax=Pandoraea sp. XJJ-1 TaxID=3002643 RepID=UPI00228071CC|nr:hypothetical protein [Pandoraea sp. XJJ-1]WAL82536.1 hypothetical protein OYT13_22705 [Pandoraea sp. XJJ-1]
MDARTTLYEARGVPSDSLARPTRNLRLFPRLKLPLKGQTAEMGEWRFLADFRRFQNDSVSPPDVGFRAWNVDVLETPEVT